MPRSVGPSVRTTPTREPATTESPKPSGRGRAKPTQTGDNFTTAPTPGATRSQVPANDNASNGRNAVQTRAEGNRGAAQADEPTPASHPHLFTADGERKWKVAPPGVDVITNDTGEGDWIEKWRSPKTNKWVHNYTLATMEAKAGQKFVDNRAFAKQLPAIRKQYRADLTGEGRDQLLALVVALIDQAYFRVGNEESHKKGVHGITTLERRHVSIDGDNATFEYVGKKKVEQHRVVCDATIAGMLGDLLKKRGKKTDPMFAAGGRAVTAAEVNEYLDRFDVTAKQFRTYHATRLMRAELLPQAAATESEREGLVKAAFEKVAELLGHSPAVCRKSYVDPMVIDRFMEGRLR